MVAYDEQTVFRRTSADAGEQRMTMAGVSDFAGDTGGGETDVSAQVSAPFGKHVAAALVLGLE